MKTAYTCPTAPATSYNRFRRLAPVATILLAGAALSACSENQENETCLSAPAISKTYDGDKAADPDNRQTWLHGVLTTTIMPADAKGLVVSWRSPNSPKEWDDTSQPIDRNRAGGVALLLGDQAVTFGTQLVMEKGSPLCDWEPGDTAKHSRFSAMQPIKPLRDSGMTFPAW